MEEEYQDSRFNGTSGEFEKKKEESKRVKERSLKHWRKRCWRHALMAWKAAVVDKHDARQRKLNGRIDELALARALETWKRWVLNQLLEALRSAVLQRQLKSGQLKSELEELKLKALVLA